jgi:hypothetical protein
MLGFVLTACTMNFDAFHPGEASTDAAGVTPPSDATSAEGASEAASNSTTDAPEDTASASSDASSDAAADAHDAASGDGGGMTDAADATAKNDASDAAVPCTEVGAVTFGGHCYFDLGGSNAFNAASTACMAVGAHLVTISSSAESSAVATLGTTADRWMGLSKMTSAAAADASYHFITGEARGSYSNWATGEPNGSGDCVRMKAGGVQWGDDVCTNLHDAICERE